MDTSRNRSRGTWRGWLAGGVLAAHAGIRLSNNKWTQLCRVVVTISNHHRTRVLHDGRLRKGTMNVAASSGQAVCVQRSRVPDDCDSGLTRSQCKIAGARNRTILMTIE